MPEIEYENDVVIRKVRHDGEIQWKGKMIYVSEALAGEPIGLKQKDNHLWEIRFSFHTLGTLDESAGKIKREVNKRRNRAGNGLPSGKSKVRD